MIEVTGSRWPTVAVALVVLALGMAACGSGDELSSGHTSDESLPSSTGHSDLSGLIRVEGSSIIAPLTEAVAEGFKESNPRVGVAVGTGGTGDGFDKLCAGKADIMDADYPIDEHAEELCREAGIRYEDVAVATHALAIVVNAENPVSCLDMPQLLAIWGLDATTSNWSDVPGSKGEFDEGSLASVRAPTPVPGNSSAKGSAARTSRPPRATTTSAKTGTRSSPPSWIRPVVWAMSAFPSIPKTTTR